MLSGLLQMMGFVILKLVYGKKMETYGDFGTKLPLLLSIGFCLWLLCLLLLFTGSAAKDTWLCLVFGIGFPLAIVVWGIVVRKKDFDDFEEDSQ